MKSAEGVLASGTSEPARRPGFLRNVGLLSIGTLVGQLSILAASPILTRLYTPAEIGVYGIYTSLIGIGLILASLRYDMSIPLVKSDEDSLLVTCACIGIAFVIAGMIAITGFLFGETIGRWLGVAEASHLMLWVGAGVFSAGVFQAVSTLSIRRQAFNGLAVARASSGLGIGSGQIAFGFAGWSSTGLPLADAFGRFMAAVIAIGPLSSKLASTAKRMSVARTRVMLKGFWEFPAFILPASVFNIMATQALLLGGPKLFSASETGAFFVAYRTLYLPGSLLATAISQVFFGKIANAEKSESGHSGPTFNILLGLLAFGTPIYIGVWIHSLTIFPLVFGREWQLAGAYAFLMAPYLLLWLPTTAISSVLLVKRRFKASLLVNIVHLLLAAIGLAWGAWRNSFFDSVIVHSLLSFALYGFGIWWFGYIAGVNLKNLFHAYINVSLKWNLPSFTAQWLAALWSPIFGLLTCCLLTPMVLILSIKAIKQNVLHTEYRKQ